MKSLFYSCLLCVAVGTSCWAQSANDEKNELSITFGSTIVPDSQRVVSSPILAEVGRKIDFDSALTIQVDYWRHLFATDAVEFSAGLGVSASPNDQKLSSGPASSPSQYAFLFVTPQVRVKFAPKRAIQPFFLVGGGLANYKEAALFGRDATGRPIRNHDQGTNGSTVAFGGGVDFRAPFKVPAINKPLGFRLEVRDNYAETPNFRVKTNSDRQHNLFFGGGVFIRF